MGGSLDRKSSLTEKKNIYSQVLLQKFKKKGVSSFKEEEMDKNMTYIEKIAINYNKKNV